MKDRSFLWDNRIYTDSNPAIISFQSGNVVVGEIAMYILDAEEMIYYPFCLFIIRFYKLCVN